MAAQKNIRFIFWTIIIFFGLIFCSISLVNHYMFRTYAWDLGIYVNAMYDYTHFRWNDCTIMQPKFENVLSDHFELYPIIFSPLRFLLGSYTLLLVQIAIILLGGFGIYKYVILRSGEKNLALLAMAHFFSIWAVYSALSFDYHNNVIAAMLVPWLFYYFDKEKFKLAALFFFLILIAKENMALWMVFISIGLLLLNLKNKQKVKISAIFILSAVLYFVLILKVVIPSLANEGREYLHFNYQALGQNFGEAIKTILTRPFYAIKLLFIDPEGNQWGSEIKQELFFMLLVSGGYSLLYRPQYLLMLIPIFGQKLFNSDFNKWGLNHHYSIEFVPILSIALFHFINNFFRNNKLKIYFGIAALVLTITFTAIKFDNRRSRWYNGVENQFYKKTHYTQNFDVNEAYKAIKLIPPNAALSAQAMIVPHLAEREDIYVFPWIQKAEYIALFLKAPPYPATKEAYAEKINELLSSGQWEKFYHNDNVLILKKK